MPCSSSRPSGLAPPCEAQESGPVNHGRFPAVALGQTAGSPTRKGGGDDCIRREARRVHR
jgi:hypothetical protein